MGCRRARRYIEHGRAVVLEKVVHDRWHRVRDTDPTDELAEEELALMFRLLMAYETKQREVGRKTKVTDRSWALIKSILIYASITVRRPINNGRMMYMLRDLLRLDPIGLRWKLLKSKPVAGNEIKTGEESGKKLMKALNEKAGKEVITFTASEFASFAFKASELAKESYVRVGTVYYQPIGAQQASKAVQQMDEDLSAAGRNSVARSGKSLWRQASRLSFDETVTGVAGAPGVSFKMKPQLVKQGSGRPGLIRQGSSGRVDPQGGQGSVNEALRSISSQAVMTLRDLIKHTYAQELDLHGPQLAARAKATVWPAGADARLGKPPNAAERAEHVDGVENLLQALLTLVIIEDRFLPVMGVIAHQAFQQFNWTLDAQAEDEPAANAAAADEHAPHPSGSGAAPSAAAAVAIHPKEHSKPQPLTRGKSSKWWNNPFALFSAAGDGTEEVKGNPSAKRRQAIEMLCGEEPSRLQVFDHELERLSNDARSGSNRGLAAAWLPANSLFARVSAPPSPCPLGVPWRASMVDSPRCHRPALQGEADLVEWRDRAQVLLD